MTRSDIAIIRIGDTIDRLGEGPVWDGESQCLHWIDSLAGVLHRLHPASGARHDFSVPAPIGSFTLTARGDAVLALRDGFHRYDFTTGRTSSWALPGTDHPALRFNDGKTDRQGRFLAGTMHADLPVGATPLGGLFRLDPDASTHLLVPDIATANGPCFSPDGRTLYCADSTRQTIWAFDYDTDSGIPTRQRVFADLAPLGTAPDGATVDADGHLWSALVRSGQIGRFDPEGRLVTRIDTPVTRPTSLAFGGLNLDTLYFTSISASHRFTATEAGAGGLFAIEGLGVAGLPEARFAG